MIEEIIPGKPMRLRIGPMIGTLLDWSEAMGIHENTLWSRLNRGWSPYDAVMTPKGRSPKKRPKQKPVDHERENLSKERADALELIEAGLAGKPLETNADDSIELRQIPPIGHRDRRRHNY